MKTWYQKAFKVIFLILNNEKIYFLDLFYSGSQGRAYLFNKVLNVQVKIYILLNCKNFNKIFFNLTFRLEKLKKVI